MLPSLAERGDDVLDYIQDTTGEMPRSSDAESWSGMAAFYLSYAVDLWASGMVDEYEAEGEELSND